MGDQEIKCQFSWIEPKKMMVTDDAGVETEKDGSNKADICYVKVKINKNDGGKYKDIHIMAGKKMTMYWKVNSKPGEVKGMFDMLLIEDPMNPTLGGASALTAGLVSFAALYATIA